MYACMYTVADDGRSVFPLMHNGVAHMSFGWLVDLMSKKWSDSVVDWTADEVRAGWFAWDADLKEVLELIYALTPQ